MQNAVSLVMANGSRRVNQKVRDNTPLFKSIPEIQLTRTCSYCLSTGAELLV